MEVLPPGFEGWSFLEQIGVGSAPTVDKVKATYKKWALRLHPDKNMNNVAKATQLFKRLTSGYKQWKGAPGVAPPRPAEEPPNYQFNPTYFRSKFCNPTSSARQTAPEEAQTSAKNPETEDEAEGFWSFLWRSRRPGCSEHARGMGASWGEGTPKGAPPTGFGTQRTRRVTFHDRFGWQTHNLHAIQADRILAEKRRRGWFLDYPEAGSNMYLLAPDQVHKVRVLASSVWVPEVRHWEPEVFIIGEGINFTVEDTMRLMQNLHKANIIAEQVGIRLYKE